MESYPILITIALLMSFINHFRSFIADILYEKCEKYKEYLKVLT